MNLTKRSLLRLMNVMISINRRYKILKEYNKVKRKSINPSQLLMAFFEIKICKM